MNIMVRGKWIETDTRGALKEVVRHGSILLLCEEDDLLDLMITGWKCMVKVDIVRTEAIHPYIANKQNSLNHTIQVYEVSLKTPHSIFRFGDDGGKSRNKSDSTTRSSEAIPRQDG